MTVTTSLHWNSDTPSGPHGLHLVPRQTLHVIFLATRGLVTAEVQEMMKNLVTRLIVGCLPCVRGTKFLTEPELRLNRYTLGSLAHHIVSLFGGGKR